MKKNEDIYKITCILIMFDQFIKLLINKHMKINTGIEIIPKFFSIFYVKNKGAAFSILENNQIIIIIISVISIIIIDRYIKITKKHTPLEIFSLGIILGGIFGNLLDRIIHHGVIDYLSFKLGSYYFPIFNLADIGITIGVLLLIISYILEEKKKRGSNKSI